METNYQDIAVDFAAHKMNQESVEWRLGYQAVLDGLRPLKGQAILDFGCGPGIFSQVLSRGGAKVLGLDQAPKMIELARAHDPLGRYDLYRGLLADQLRGQMFDAICATFVFCTMADTELRYILRDMRSLLRPEGKLLVLEINLAVSMGVEYADMCYEFGEVIQPGERLKVTFKQKPDLVFTDVYRRHDDYLVLFEEAGFTVEKMEEPRPDTTWGERWETELKYPPFLLITAR